MAKQSKSAVSHVRNQNLPHEQGGVEYKMTRSWSVVITTRNRADMLRRAIESCLHQSVPCEVVVVDEASSDHTSEVAKSFPEVKYLRNEVPIGHPAAANLGIQESSGTWIKPLDDDDWLDEQCIERMDRGVAAAEAAGLDPVIVTGVAMNVDDKGRPLGRTQFFSASPMGLRSKEVLSLMLDDRAPIGTPVQVGHSKETAMSVGGWSPEKDFIYPFGDEARFWIKLAASGDIVFLPEVVGFRTMWPGGMSMRKSLDTRFHGNLELKALIAAELGQEISSGAESYLALHWAMVALRMKDIKQAAKLALIWIRRPDSIIKFYLRTKKASNKAIVLTV